MVVDDRPYNCNYSKFDLEQHQKHYIHYLEVCIDANGEVHYAHPSHQQWMIRHAMQKLSISYEHLNALFLMECSMFDSFLKWLCDKTEAVAVWTSEYLAPTGGLNDAQRLMLTDLSIAGVYEGDVNDEEVEGMKCYKL